MNPLPRPSSMPNAFRRFQITLILTLTISSVIIEWGQSPRLAMLVGGILICSLFLRNLTWGDQTLLREFHADHHPRILPPILILGTQVEDKRARESKKELLSSTYNNKRWALSILETILITGLCISTINKIQANHWHFLDLAYPVYFFLLLTSVYLGHFLLLIMFACLVVIASLWSQEDITISLYVIFLFSTFLTLGLYNQTRTDLILSRAHAGGDPERNKSGGVLWNAIRLTLAFLLLVYTTDFILPKEGTPEMPSKSQSTQPASSPFARYRVSEKLAEEIIKYQNDGTLPLASSPPTHLPLGDDSNAPLDPLVPAMPFPHSNLPPTRLAGDVAPPKLDGSSGFDLDLGKGRGGAPLPSSAQAKGSEPSPPTTEPADRGQGDSGLSPTTAKNGTAPEDPGGSASSPQDNLPPHQGHQGHGGNGLPQNSPLGPNQPLQQPSTQQPPSNTVSHFTEKRPLTKKDLQDLTLKIDLAMGWLLRALVILIFAFALWFLLKILANVTKDHKPQNANRRQVPKDLLKSALSELKAIRLEHLTPNEEVIRTYNLFLMLMRQTPVPKADFTPPLDYQTILSGKMPAISSQTRHLTTTFCRCLYGEITITNSELKDFRTASQTVMTHFSWH